MRCPKCNSDTKVVDSRETNDGSIRRRRRCEKCNCRFSTYETMELPKMYGVYDYNKNTFVLGIKESSKAEVRRKLLKSIATTSKCTSLKRLGLEIKEINQEE